MNRIIKISAIVLISMALSSCTFLSRAQVDSLRETAFLLEKRAEINDKGKGILGETLGSDHAAIKLIDQNSESERKAAIIIRNLVGSSEE